LLAIVFIQDFHSIFPLQPSGFYFTRNKRNTRCRERLAQLIRGIEISERVGTCSG